MPMNEQVCCDFGFHLEYLDDAQQVVRDSSLQLASFGHAIRATRFDAFRRGRVAEYIPRLEGARIEPIFSERQQDSPKTSGFTVTVALAGTDEHRFEFDTEYFRATANRMRAELLRQDQLELNHELYFRLCAFLDEGLAPSQSANLEISLEPSSSATPVMECDASLFEATSHWGERDDSELRVVFDRSVIDDAVEEANGSPKNEVAGFLLGHLVRIRDTRDVMVVVTGLVPARDTTESSISSVTYTPASFAMVRNVISLRASNERIVGWIHSHPFRFCDECPLPTPTECIDKVLFYSQDDIHLMETTFEQPFMVGLLAATEPRIETALGHPPVRAYGWSHGRIKQRGLEVKCDLKLP